MATLLHHISRHICFSQFTCQALLYNYTADQQHTQITRNSTLQIYHPSPQVVATQHPQSSHPFNVLVHLKCTLVFSSENAVFSLMYCIKDHHLLNLLLRTPTFNSLENSVLTLGKLDVMVTSPILIPQSLCRKCIHYQIYQSTDRFPFLCKLLISLCSWLCSLIFHFNLADKRGKDCTTDRLFLFC